MPIRFFYEEVDFKIKSQRKITHWINESIKRERKKIGEINYIFCCDSYLLNLNRDFLGHNTLTDIITFDYSEGDSLAGEIYISIERVRENALKFDTEPLDELNRVMIHGVLHLSGYNDKLQSEKSIMRKKEDAYLSLRKKLFHVKQ